MNLGCGPRVKRTSWDDFDGSWNLLWQKSLPGRFLHGALRIRPAEAWPSHVGYLDLTRRLPFDDHSIDAVYASHVLEHLHHDEAMGLITECKRVLKEGGVVRLVLPDTRRLIDAYLTSEDPCAVAALNAGLMYRPMSRPSSIARRLYEAVADLHSHKFMYDEAYIIHRLGLAGFREAGVRGCLDSRIPETVEVEDPGRVLNGAGFVVEALA